MENQKETTSEKKNVFRKVKWILLIAAGVFGAMVLIIHIYAFYIYVVKQPENRVLQKDPRKIDQNGITISCSPPLKRTQGSTFLKIGIDEDWEVLSAEGFQFRLPDGQTGRLVVQLKIRAGKIYMPDTVWIGVKEGKVGISFIFNDKIPKNEEITEVSIQSDIAFKCTEIVWGNYYPK